MTRETSHSLSSALGNALSGIGDTLKDAALLGVGSAGGILLANLVLSKASETPSVAPWVSKLGPWGVAATGLAFGMGLDKYGSKLPLSASMVRALSDGVKAGTVGLALSTLVTTMTSPRAAAEAAATSGLAGLGFGRAFIQGYGRAVGQLPAASALYSVGSDVGAANMFGGATVQYEEKGRLAGATVQYEEQSALGALN